SNLKTTGQGIAFYTTDNRFSLPGPSHPLIFCQQFDAQYAAVDGAGNQYNYDTVGWYRRQSLLNFLRRYFEKGKSGTTTDQISSSPTNASIVNITLKDLMAWGVYNPTSYFRPFHYFLNTWRTGKGLNVQGQWPYSGTRPPWYFGYIC